MEGSPDPRVVRVAGYSFPSDPGLSPEERIVHLEETVRSFHAGMLVLAAQLERLSRDPDGL